MFFHFIWDPVLYSSCINDHHGSSLFEIHPGLHERKEGQTNDETLSF